MRDSHGATDTLDRSWQGFSLNVVRARTFHRIHQHDDVEVSVIDHGETTLLFGQRRRSGKSGSLGVLWAMIPHGAVEITKGNPLSYSLHIPLSWVLQWQLPSSFLRRLLGGELIRDQPRQEPCSDLELLKHWHRLLSEKDPAAAEIVLLEAQARLRRLARSLEASKTGRTRGTDDGTAEKTGLFERMVAEIARRHREPLRVRDVARAVNISPSHAMFLFHKACGSTIQDYIRSWRVSTAQRLLATTPQKIAAVAQESGFTSMARFHAVFKRVCGQTPKKYRDSFNVQGKKSAAVQHPRRPWR